ncbi:MAG: sulfotransferase [Boseongicola sp.]|nr:sulfotransferase [Boseongicola sp.]
MDNRPPRHFFATAPFSVWARLLWENRGVDRSHIRNALKVLGKSASLAPLRLVERVIYDRQMDSIHIDKSPVFVLGYYRSGTTHLHNLLCQDPQFGWVTTFQTAVASFFLLAQARVRLRNAIETKFPPTRPMDNVSFAPDTPQEEELAVGNTSRFSHVYSFSFPRRSYDYLEKYALMRGLSEREIRQWNCLYLNVLRKASLFADGKRLVLKSPANTGRAAYLLRLFPDAKFVNIARNPLNVVESNLHLYRTFFRPDSATLMQSATADEMLDYIVHAYAEMTRQYLADRSVIPSGNLAEVRFEDLEADPAGELERIYRDLSLPGWTEARPKVESYLHSINGYKKNRLSASPEVVEMVNGQLGFIQNEWGYPEADI